MGMAQRDNRMAKLESVAAKLVHLTHADTYNPYADLEWPSVIDGLWMAPELMSVHGTPLADELDEHTYLDLNKWECTKFFSLNVNGIRDLLVALTQRLHAPGYENISEYMHCFITEENEHMWYFAKFCDDYAGKIYEERAVGAEEVPEKDIDNFLIFARALVFEQLVDIYNRKMGEDERLHPFARQLNQLHHVDEVRHIAYGQLYCEVAFRQLEEKHPQSRLDAVREALERFIRLCIVRLYPAEAYRDTGLERPVRIRSELLRHPARIEYNDELSAAIAKPFVTAGILPAQTSHATGVALMSTPSLADRLKELVIDNINGIEDAGTLTSEARLVDLGMDSVSGLGLLLAIEEEFEVRVPEDLLMANETFEICGNLETALQSLGAR